MPPSAVTASRFPPGSSFGIIGGGGAVEEDLAGAAAAGLCEGASALAATGPSPWGATSGPAASPSRATSRPPALFPPGIFSSSPWASREVATAEGSLCLCAWGLPNRDRRACFRKQAGRSFSKPQFPHHHHHDGQQALPSEHTWVGLVRRSDTPTLYYYSYPIPHRNLCGL